MTTLNRQGVPFAEFDDVLMQEAAAQVRDLNKTWKLKVSTCAEEIDLFARYGIQQDRCIDDGMIENCGFAFKPHGDGCHLCRENCDHRECVVSDCDHVEVFAEEIMSVSIT